MLFGAGIFCGPASAQDFIIGSAEAAVIPHDNLHERQFQFAIPPQTLESALNAFTAVTGIQVFYSSALADGRASPGVTGIETAHAALWTLLSGTSLAPIASSRDAVTLISSAGVPPRILPMMEADRSPHAPILTLSTLQVEAPIVRGYEAYAATVKFKIQTALSADQGVRQRRYQTAINVWVSPVGTVQHSEIFTSTGDSHLDETISSVVRRLGDLAAPPTNLPQPLHIRIHVNG